MRVTPTTPNPRGSLSTPSHFGSQAQTPIQGNHLGVPVSPPNPRAPGMAEWEQALDEILDLESSSPLVKAPGRSLCGFLDLRSLFAPIKSLFALLYLGLEEQASSRSAREVRVAPFEPSSSSHMKAAAPWLCISQRGCSMLYMLIPTVSYHCVGAKCGDPSPSSSIIPHKDAHLHGHTHTQSLCSSQMCRRQRAPESLGVPQESAARCQHRGRNCHWSYLTEIRLLIPGFQSQTKQGIKISQLLCCSCLSEQADATRMN